MDCLPHPIQMAGIETIWELHTLTVINSRYSTSLTDEMVLCTLLKGHYNKYTHTQAIPVFGYEETQWLAFHIQDSPADLHQSW